MSGSIDQIDAISLPLCCHGGGNDCDSAFAFLGHPVGDGRAVINISEAISFAGVKQNPLGSSSFTCVNMGNYADITV